MNESQRRSFINRLQREYDREKASEHQKPEVRVGLLIAEALVEIDRSFQFFVDEFERERAEREKEQDEYEKDRLARLGDDDD